MEDLYCPQCGEILTNDYECSQCSWSIPYPERYIDFRYKTKKLRRQMTTLAQYGEHVEGMA